MMKLIGWNRWNLARINSKKWIYGQQKSLTTHMHAEGDTQCRIIRLDSISRWKGSVLTQMRSRWPMFTMLNGYFNYRQKRVFCLFTAAYVLISYLAETMTGRKYALSRVGGYVFWQIMREKFFVNFFFIPLMFALAAHVCGMAAGQPNGTKTWFSAWSSRCECNVAICFWRTPSDPQLTSSTPVAFELVQLFLRGYSRFALFSKLHFRNSATFQTFDDLYTLAR